MCGRTSLYVDPAEPEAAFDATIGFDYRPRYNIAPRDDLAVITNAADETIDQQEWGLVAPWRQVLLDLIGSPLQRRYDVLCGPHELLTVIRAVVKVLGPREAWTRSRPNFESSTTTYATDSPSTSDIPKVSRWKYPVRT